MIGIALRQTAKQPESVAARHASAIRSRLGRALSMAPRLHLHPGLTPPQQNGRRCTAAWLRVRNVIYLHVRLGVLQGACECRQRRGGQRLLDEREELAFLQADVVEEDRAELVQAGELR